MSKTALTFTLLGTALVCSLYGAPAKAQSRVFVSATGSDSNPCSFVSPCRTFQHAHDVVAAGGEIDVLDPAGYGAVTISKAISIQGHGYAGIAVPSGDGITINAGTTDLISLRGLLIDGVGSGSNGIKYNTGASLVVEESLIRNFGINGIYFTPNGASSLLVSNTRISDNGTNAQHNGISVQPAGSAVVTGAYDHVILENNAYGARFEGGGTGQIQIFTISNSLVSKNSVDGVFLDTGATSVMVRDSTIVNNQFGLVSNALLRITRSTITGNGTGLLILGGGNIISFGDNSLAGNTTDGLPSNTIMLK
jgi:hypothetical protein